MNVKPVPGLENYCEASDCGAVFSIERSAKRSGGIYRVSRRELSQKTNRYGYKCIAFHIDGKRVTFQVHRLVMLAFCEKDEMRPFVNHKNGIRNDNRLDNLEWCSASENAKHAYSVLNSRRGGKGRLGIFHQRSMKIVGRNQKSGEEVFFNAMMDAQRSGYNASCICECIAGTQKTHRGMVWSKV